MWDVNLCFGVLFCAIELTHCVSKIFIESTTNTCSCVANSSSLTQCVFVCFQSLDCKGVTLDKGNNSCCLCSTLAVPDQSSGSGRVLYRTESVQNCVPDLVDDIPDAQMTASSSYSNYHGPERARLHTKRRGPFRGAWCTATLSTTGEYIQSERRWHYRSSDEEMILMTNCVVADCQISQTKVLPICKKGLKRIDGEQFALMTTRFSGIKKVTGVATQGRKQYKQWVTSYNVSYSINCMTFAFVKDNDSNPKLFPGNDDRESVVLNNLQEPILAVCVRVHPFTFNKHPCLRFGIKGCDFIP